MRKLAFEIDEWVIKLGGEQLGLMFTSWWADVNGSVEWQDGIFFTLCALFALVSSAALVQLIRIQQRVPGFGWMNMIVNGVRAVEFGFHRQVFTLNPKVLTSVLLDFPGLLFFSTYTLLVLFWADICHQVNIEQARGLPADKLRLFYALINAGIYSIQVCIWIFIWLDDNDIVEFLGRIFIAVISFVAALGFLVYGGRLFLMLKQFPIESRGRRQKLYEVGSVTAVCFTCFLIRCVVVSLSAFDADASLDVMDHPILDFIYYMLVEILPSGLVLIILRKMPSRQVSARYHPIH